MIDLPSNIHWFDFATWISRGFFSDCLELIGTKPEYTDLKFKIEKAQKQSVYLLNLSSYTLHEMKLFKLLVRDVIQLNVERAGKNFHKPESISVYLNKIQTLANMVDDAISEMGGNPHIDR